MRKKIKIIDLIVSYANGEKQPRKIKFDNKKYTYNGNSVLQQLLDEYNIYVLNEEVEILDEEDEFEDIYLLCDNSEQYNFSSRQTGMTKEDRRLLDSNFKELLMVINQLIKNQKKIIEIIKKEGK